MDLCGVMLGAHSGQKRALDLQHVEFQKLLVASMGAGNQTPGLCKSSACSKLLNQIAASAYIDNELADKSLKCHRGNTLGLLILSFHNVYMCQIITLYLVNVSKYVPTKITVKNNSASR